MKRKISKRRKNSVINLKDFRKKKNLELFTKIKEEIQSIRKRKALEAVNLEYLDIFETENEGMIVVTDDINIVYTDLMFDKNKNLVPFRRKNPRDEKLLNQINITKNEGSDFGYNYAHYKIWLNNELIGDAQYILGKDYISLVYIIPKYQRKGLATFLYDYIEQDQGIILRSDASTRSAKAFWANRLKQRKNPRDKKLSNRIKRGNPRDESLLEKLKIKKEKDKLNNSIIRYDVYYNNEVIGYSFFDKIRIPYYLDLIYIEPEFRRKGVAEFLTNYIEKDQKIKLNASPNMNKDGKAFWDSRLKNIK